jgi:hypothetical protein
VKPGQELKLIGRWTTFFAIGRFAASAGRRYRRPLPAIGWWNCSRTCHTPWREAQDFLDRARAAHPVRPPAHHADAMRRELRERKSLDGAHRRPHVAQQWMPAREGIEGDCHDHACPLTIRRAAWQMTTWCRSRSARASSRPEVGQGDSLEAIPIALNETSTRPADRSQVPVYGLFI